MGADNAFGYSEGNAHQPLRPVLAVAIETTERGEFTGARGTSYAEFRHTQSWETPDDLLRDFVRFSYRGYEMLLYQADFGMKYLIPPLERLIADGYECNFTLDNRNRIIYCKIKRDKHNWYIRDACAMLPLELSELRKLAGLSDDAPLESVLLKSYSEYRDTLRETFNVKPSITAGTTALWGWATTLPEHRIFYRQRAEVEQFARAGYFGGLSYIEDFAEKADCTYLDVNAMYAHAMRQGVPVMSPTYVSGKYYAELPGIYRCTAWCPASQPVPFVPMRNAHGVGCVCPRDLIFETIIPNTTIQLALELGYRITVHEGYVFEKIENVFDAFVEKCQTLENKYRDLGARYAIKALRNSLTGKFGMRPEGREYILTGADPGGLIDDGWTEVVTWEGDWIEHLYYREIEIERSFMQPVWAMWITANARNILTRAIYALGTSAVHYADTDGIVIDNAALDGQGVIVIGTQYGEWKEEELLLDFRAMGKGFYKATNTDGEIIIKSPGIPKGVLTASEVAQILPHAPPVSTREYTQQRRAIHTFGGRPTEEHIVKQIVIPELQPTWAE